MTCPGGWVNEKKNTMIRCNSDVCTFSDMSERHIFGCVHKSTSVCNRITPNSHRHSFQRKIIRLEEKICIEDIKLISLKNSYEKGPFPKPESTDIQDAESCANTDSKLCPEHLEYIDK